MLKAMCDAQAHYRIVAIDASMSVMRSMSRPAVAELADADIKGGDSF